MAEQDSARTGSGTGPPLGKRAPWIGISSTEGVRSLRCFLHPERKVRDLLLETNMTIVCSFPPRSLQQLTTCRFLQAASPITTPPPQCSLDPFHFKWEKNVPAQISGGHRSVLRSGCKRWASNPSGQYSYKRPTSVTVCGTMRSICGADAGDLAIGHHSLLRFGTYKTGGAPLRAVPLLASLLAILA
jgi:hypothetical protein